MHEKCLDNLKFDIVGIEETHLINKQELKLKNHTNHIGMIYRRDIHFCTDIGFGGVGFLIKKTLLNDFNVFVLDDSYKGILWPKFNHNGAVIV